MTEQLKPNAMDLANKAVDKAPKIKSIQELVEDSAKQLGRALPSHMKPERIVRIALTCLRLNPQLYKCDPSSFLAALFQSAQLGLEPNVNGEAWIIPYSNKGRLMAQFQVGAYGLVKLFWNHQNAVSLQVEKVHANDHFTYDLGAGTVTHVPPPFGDERGDVRGYYAYATLSNNGHALKVLSKNEAMQLAIKHSKCYDRVSKDFYPGTPWREHFDAMAMKTVAKQLLKILPRSVELQKAMAMDETVKTKLDVDMITVPDETDYSSEQLEVEGVK